MDSANNDVIEVMTAEIIETTPEIKSVSLPKFRTLEKDAETDYNYVRDNMKSIIERGSSALDEMLALASQIDHPRAYEVIAQLIKSLTDSNLQLIDMHREIKDIADDKGTKKTGKGTTNIAFFGSTHELQKLIKGKTKIEDIPIMEDSDG